MEALHDIGAVGFQAIVDGVREPPDERAATAPVHFREHLRMAADVLEDDGDRA